jgi:2-polyprenyl-3-methyl-5-hydroxy-6-metoxy-1,4-benzoquinol methylase
MAKTFLAKISCYQKDGQLPGKISILDYGCGKGHFVKSLLALSNFTDCWLYDISDDYLPNWSDNVPRDHYACFDIPEAWAGKFDIITSLLSLEHVCNPAR